MIASIITCYGLPELTDSLIGDLVRDNYHTDVFVIDNKGDYECKYKSTDNVHIGVYRPGENLRWAKGMNYGLRQALDTWGYEAFILFNNDIKLSPNFLENMYGAHMENDNLGLLAPMYDDVYDQQKGSYRGDAYKYKPVVKDQVVNLVDGTLFYIPFETIEKIGGIDDDIFGFTGWGGDLDYCHRVKEAGFDVVVTHRAYINHFHQGTVKVLHGDWNAIAGPDMEESMNKKYGPQWRDIIYRPLD